MEIRVFDVLVLPHPSLDRGMLITSTLTMVTEIASDLVTRVYDADPATTGICW